MHCSHGGFSFLPLLIVITAIKVAAVIPAYKVATQIKDVISSIPQRGIHHYESLCTSEVIEKVTELNDADMDQLGYNFNS